MEPYSYIPVANARPAIRKVIAKGGSAMVKVGNEIRCLQHFPSCDRPRLRLPWPFSKIQPFRFTISKWIEPPKVNAAHIEFPSLDRFACVLNSDRPTMRTEYNQTQVRDAIETFLSDCQEDDEVSVSYNPP